MRIEQIALMRQIWDDQMQMDGYIWKYKSWLHFDFEHGWCSVIIPRSVAQGHAVDIGYAVCTLDQVTPDFLRRDLHQCAAPRAWQLYSTDEPKPMRAVQDDGITDVSFRQGLNEYMTFARKPLLQVRSLGDAVRFQIERESHGRPHYSDCKRYVDLFLYAGDIPAALKAISLARQSVEYLIGLDRDAIRDAERRIEELANPVNTMSWFSPSERAYQLEYWKKHKAECETRIRANHQKAFSWADKEEAQIHSGRYQEAVAAVCEKIRINADLLARMFTKREKAIMMQTEYGNDAK